MIGGSAGTGETPVLQAECEAMPELPEVETVARQLRRAICGRTVTRVEVLDKLLGLRPRDVAPLAGRAIDDVKRIGKQVVLALGPNGDARRPAMFVAVHLRMTGRLIVTETPPLDAKGKDHTRARFQLDEGSLLFSDVRRFGTIKLATDEAALDPGALDPMSRAFTPARLAELIDGAATPLKVWLLRQDRLVGIGNIYASEICYIAGLKPARAAGSLKPAQIESLHTATRAVLKAAIAACGTTFSDFQDAYGVTGSYQNYLRVYGREGEPCGRCGKTIKRTVQAQRSTFHCPGCQR